MADEIIKKALTLDLGDSINTVKELKNYINQLRDSLIGVDEESDEYKATVDQLSIAQDKLNKVMNAGKRSADAAEGSYDALQKQMNELKKVWKSTADVVERDAIGKQINSLNDQLKDLDATIGNHQRNVGNYGSALDGLFADLGEVTQIGKDATGGFEGLGAVLGLTNEQTQAFNDNLNKLKAALKISEALSKVAKGTNDYSKAQAAANVATKGGVAGMKALKVAIAATGIGLLVTGLAFLVTNFDKVKEAIQPVIDKFGDFREKAIGVLKQITGGVVGVGNVIGQALLVPIKNALDGFKGLGEVLDNLVHFRFKDAGQAAKNSVKDIMENFKDGFSLKKNFLSGKEVGEQFFDTVASAIAKKKAEEAGEETGKSVVKGVKKALSQVDIVSLIKESDNKKAIEAFEKMYLDMQKELNDWQRDQDPLFKAIDDEVSLNIRYDELKNAYEQLGKDTTVLDQWYADQRTKIWDEANAHLVESSVEAANQIIEAEQKQADVALKAKQTRLQGIGAIGDALSNLGGLFDENTAAYKASAIAQALISTYLAADQVLATEPGEMWVKVAAMAAVLTAGLANVASIVSVNPKGENSVKGAGSNPSPAIPIIGDVQPINYTRNIVSASEEERLNQPIQAFVVESEVTASQELAMRRKRNSTF